MKKFIYVDTAANALQDNLPEKTTDKVATYTNTAGTTGEREIKTALGNEQQPLCVPPYSVPRLYRRRNNH